MKLSYFKNLKNEIKLFLFLKFKGNLVTLRSIYSKAFKGTEKLMVYIKGFMLNYSKRFV